VTRVQSSRVGGYSSLARPDVTAPVAGPATFAKPKFDSVTLLSAYLILLFFIPSTLVFGPLGGAGTPAIVISLCILLWYTASWISGQIIPSGGGRPVRIGMFIFSIAALASFVAAMTRDISSSETLGADRELIILASWVGLVVVMSQSITSYDRLNTLLRRAVVGGSIVGLIGIVQHYVGIDVTKVLQIPGLVPRVDATTLLNRNGLNRPSSTTTQPIEFGVVMAMLLPFSLQQAFSSAPADVKPGRFRRWAPVVLIALAIPISLSRSGIVGAAVAMLFLLPTWNLRRRLAVLGSVLFGLVGLKGAAPGLIHTLLTYFGGLLGNSSSYIGVQSRTADYGYVFYYVAQRPFFGMGFGTFSPQLYIFTDNTYLLGLVETGFVGVAALLVLYLTAMYCAAAGRRRTRDEGRRETGQALLASIAVGIVASATFDAIKFPMFSGLFFLVIGAAGAYYSIMTMEGLASNPASTPSRLGLRREHIRG
jgi:polysaccharide biosynthesis protein PslJ